MHDLDYHARRARSEAVRAIATERRDVAAIHQELCLLHSARLVAALIAGERWR